MKQCPSFHGYSATADGQIISHRRRGVGMQRGSVSTIDLEHQYVLSQHKTKKGYRNVSIVMSTGKARPVGVHQLIADAFHGPRPDGMQVRHLDGAPGNNCPDNLVYGTPVQNANDRLLHGTYTQGGGHHNSKLTDQQAASIRQLRSQKVRVKDLANRFGVSLSCVESVIYQKSFKRVKP